MDFSVGKVQVMIPPGHPVEDVQWLVELGVWGSGEILGMDKAIGESLAWRTG